MSIEDYQLIQYQILQIGIIGIVWQIVRRFTNEILEVKGLGSWWDYSVRTQIVKEAGLQKATYCCRVFQFLLGVYDIVEIDIFNCRAIGLSLLLSTKYSCIRAICGRHCEERELMNEKIINRRLYFNLLKIYP